MPDRPDAITRLRKASYALEDLPETIAFPQRAGEEPRDPLPVVEAMGTVAPQFAAAPAQGHAPQQPTTATRPSQPASAPGAAGRPSWAQ